MNIFQMFSCLAFITTIVTGKKYFAEIADDEPGPAPESGNDGNDGEDFKWRWVDGIGKAVFKAGKVLTG